MTCSLLVDVVKFLHLHVLVSRVDLDFEITFALGTSLVRTANDSESVRIVNLLVELNLGTENSKINDAGLGDDDSLVELGKEFTLVAANHPSNLVLALESAAKVTFLR